MRRMFSAGTTRWSSTAKFTTMERRSLWNIATYLSQQRSVASSSAAAPNATPDPTLRHPAAFKAAPNIGPGRGKGQEANPFKSWEHMNHKWLILMCMGSLAGGYSAGYFVDVDESAIQPKFDRQKVVEDMKKTFEFRPDLAPTSIRVAFVLAARRASVPALTCDESCAVVNGLEDIAGVYNFICGQHNITMEDCVSLMAVTAVKYLNGPCAQLEASWRWGRNDGDAKPRRVAAAAAVPPPTTGTQQPTPAAPAPQANSPSSSSSAVGTSSAPTGAAAAPPVVLQIPTLLKAMGDLADEECVALLGGAHSIGEFHPHVSGIEDAVHCPGNGFTLDNRYFRFLLAVEKKHTQSLNPKQQQQQQQPSSTGGYSAGWKPIEVSRIESNKGVQHLPVTMRCTYGQLSDVLSTSISAAGKGGASRPMADRDDSASLTSVTNKKKGPKSYFCVANGREIDCLLRHPEWRVHTERFAADPVAWGEVFQRAMGKMLDSNFSKLRPFPAATATASQAVDSAAAA